MLQSPRRLCLLALLLAALPSAADAQIPGLRDALDLVRCLPRGYSDTVVQPWVPQGSPAVGREFDPATHIAAPGNTSRQRLIQSGRTYGSQG